MTEAAATTEFDTFGAPSRGAYPSLDELEGRLLLITPSKVQTVPGYKNVGTQERITADVAVLDGDNPETHDDMYLSQRGLVPMLKKCLKPGNRPSVLGRLERTPTSDWSAKAEAAGGFGALMEEWAKKGGKGDKPQFFWNLVEFTDEDAALARKYLSDRQQFANTAE